MPEGQVLEFSQVTKRFGAVTAVSDLSVRVEPGAVTGFLGPNGAGKTTSLRILLGQIRPTSGSATIGGANYSELRHPLRTVGAVLEESSYRPRRTASRQLMIAAKANGIPSARVDEVLRLVGLQDDADTRLGSYSLGMRQRLAVASALLGDPGVLVLDEPANGLDPEGIRWMRLLMRRLADEGRTVLVSSHVLSEIEQVADDVVVLSKGHAVHAGPISELADSSGGAVVVDAENRAPLITALSAAKLDFDVLRSGVTVRDSDSATVGAVAAAAGVPLTMLQQRGPSLEEVFLDLVYGRRADSPRLDTSANPVAHAPQSSSDDRGAADAALVAGGVPLAGAAAVVADGGMVVAAGAGYGTGPIETVAADDSDAADADAGVAADAETDEPAEQVSANEQGEPQQESDQADEGDQTESAEESEQAERDESGADASDDADGDESSSSDEARAAESSDDDLVDGLIEDAPIADGAAGDDESGDAADTQNDADEPETPEADDPAGDDAESVSEHPVADTDTDTDADADTDADEASTDEPSDETRRLILPLATEAVTLPGTTVEPTFTELITGLPASVTVEGADSSVPATEAIAIVTPELSHDEDDDTIDDGDDDPRLAAMRTSLSAAASRFFDGPAPDYPYSSRAARREEGAGAAGTDASADAAEPDATEKHDEEQQHDEQHHRHG
ncbi:ATP-binding cassette domain-containing protein [Microbacterium sp. OR21]|uniref:ABC transporter ATP-binding protein n=1 Tax=Microbacterium sp. OR21 TaxID=3095346 RepID=UPI0039B38937